MMEAWERNEKVVRVPNVKCSAAGAGRVARERSYLARVHHHFQLICFQLRPTQALLSATDPAPVAASSEQQERGGAPGFHHGSQRASEIQAPMVALITPTVLPPSSDAATAADAAAGAAAGTAQG